MLRAVLVSVLAVAACHSKPTAPKQPVVETKPVVALASPGPLVAGHATLACNQCHIDGTREIANAKCAACHAPLKLRLDLGRGFHASTVVRGKPCASCHLDHRGATFDPTGWTSLAGGQAAFDHDLSGWPLEGAHRKQSCTACHTQVNRSGRPVFIGASKSCGSCHASAQPHGFVKREKLACDRCHTTATWRRTKTKLAFDHDDRRDAAMPLLGEHANVACVKCHAPAKFVLGNADPGACTHCHAASIRPLKK